MKWTDIPVYVVDFEGSTRSGIVEFGVVTLQEGKIVSLHTRLCGSQEDIPAAEQRVHGLSPAQLAGAAPFSHEWARFAAWRQSGVFAAHFSATENALLRAAWPCPRLSPDFLRPGHFSADWGPWIDTGRLAVETRCGTAGASLADVVSALGREAELARAATRWCPEPRRCFHCAPYDALACALVLQVLARDPAGEPWSLSRVLASSTAHAQRREERQQARWF